MLRLAPLRQRRPRPLPPRTASPVEASVSLMTFYAAGPLGASDDAHPEGQSPLPATPFLVDTAAAETCASAASGITTTSVSILVSNTQASSDRGSRADTGAPGETVKVRPRRCGNW